MSPSKKRDGPPRAQPVQHKGVTYSIRTQAEETWGSDPLPNLATICLVASATASEAELWRVKLYDIHYAPDMERDKQEIVVTGLSLNLWRTALKASDEKGRKFTIDLKSHAVTES
ncbi:MAG: hypothetical protein H7267_04950 [Sandarakinorhabdus sp.]|nr:hypothetical protein [Sandarakinorhabdus sp.]